MSNTALKRETFKTSRLMDFFSTKELTAQIGHDQDEWPLVAIKELVDNAIDACEDADIAPEITVTVDDSGIAVTDNGLGIPAETVEGVLDYSVRVSSREAYVSPTRGAQGNALKTIVAMPFVLDGSEGIVEIEAHGIKHRIVCRVDMIKQQPEIEHHKEHGLVKNGTFVKVHWPELSCLVLWEERQRILQVLSQYAALNPHLTLSADVYGEKVHCLATSPSWVKEKWKPNEPTSAHWYSVEQLKRLISGYIALDEARGKEPRTIREFASEFRGLKGSKKPKTVTDAIGMSRQSLRALTSDGDFNNALISQLLQAMQEQSAPVKPKALGLIGKEHLEAYLMSLGGKNFKYSSELGFDHYGIPYAVEVAFSYTGNEQLGRQFVTGVNWSPAINNVFRSCRIGEMLEGMRAGEFEPIIVVIHLATAKPLYADRGKSAVMLEYDVRSTIQKAIKAVTKEWEKQRKSEERDQKKRERREKEILKEDKPKKETAKDVVFELMKKGYLHASGDGKHAALQRQIMYVIRGEVLDRTGVMLTGHYFGQTLLPAFMEENPDKAKTWNVIYDARGHFFEPHTKRRIPLGTKEVRGYVGSLSYGRFGVSDFDSYRSATLYPTYGPKNRYGAVLFIEKEGFFELLEDERLEQRYDISMMSTKGLSVIASRQLADEVCGKHGVPLLILRDFDKNGFITAKTLYSDSLRYKFTHKINVIDLGIRLDDIKKYDLESKKERVTYGDWLKESPAETLRQNGATDEEVEFLYQGVRNGYHWGYRVEINALSTPQLMDLIESKLETNSIKKIVPDSDKVLESMYRNEYARKHFNKHTEDAGNEAVKASKEIEIPEDLREKIAAKFERYSTMSWDDAVIDLVEIEDD